MKHGYTTIDAEPVGVDDVVSIEKKSETITTFDQVRDYARPPLEEEYLPKNDLRAITPQVAYQLSSPGIGHVSLFGAKGVRWANIFGYDQNGISLFNKTVHPPFYPIQFDIPKDVNKIEVKVTSIFEPDLGGGSSKVIKTFPVHTVNSTSDHEEVDNNDPNNGSEDDDNNTEPIETYTAKVIDSVKKSTASLDYKKITITAAVIAAVVLAISKIKR